MRKRKLKKYIFTRGPAENNQCKIKANREMILELQGSFESQYV